MSQLPVDLWVKAGSDGMRNGGCPVCHEVFLVLLVKAEGGALHCNVKTTNPNKPHDEFRVTGLRHVPALVHGKEMTDHLDEILEYIDKTFPDVPLTYDNPEADAAAGNVFAKFCWFMKEVNKDPRMLDAELRKLDVFLSKHPDQKFLCGNHFSHLDCQLLPRLHHIRVAGGFLKSFKIAKEYRGIWRYLKNGYSTDVFGKSCPCDQEIILHWAQRPDTMNLSKTMHVEIANQPQQFSWQIPDDVILVD